MTTKTKTVSLPAQPAAEVEVLTAPLSRAEAEAATDQDGNLTAVLALPWYTLLALGDRDDALVDRFADEVMEDLSEAWTFHSYLPVGLDPLSDPANPDMLVRVVLSPGYDEDDDLSVD
jgi:hypothetical protein